MIWFVRIRLTSGVQRFGKTAAVSGNTKMEKRCIFAATIVAATLAPAYAAPGCQPADRIGETIEILGNRKIKIVDQTIVDKAAQSTLRQKLLALDGRINTDKDAQEILVEMFTRARTTCRRFPLSGVIIFVYGSEDATPGTNWIARLDTRSGMTPVIDVQQAFLGGATAASVCETPNPPKPSGKSFRSSDEIDLPPLAQRKVIGTWYQGEVIGGTCSRSFEEVKGKVYEVLRCSDCSGGKTGTPLVKSAGGIFTKPGRRNGEYFKILPNGNLASYDRDGHIDTHPKLPGIWP